MKRSLSPIRFESETKRSTPDSSEPGAITPENITVTLLPSTITESIATSESSAMVTVRDGLRFVQPYYFDFRCHVKGRWVGKKAVEVFTSEFLAFPREHYEEAAANGGILVISRHDPHGDHSAVNRVLLNNDLLIHRALVREHPVPATPINIIFENENLLVVDKPAGWPVHPSGNYRVNSVVRALTREPINTPSHDSCLPLRPDPASVCYLSNKQLRIETGAPPPSLYPLHRLDRPTSGALLFGKDGRTAQVIQGMLAGRAKGVGKVYLARVKGEFKESCKVNGDMVCLDAKLGKYGLDGMVREGIEGETRQGDRDDTHLISGVKLTKPSDPVSNGKASCTRFYPLLVSQNESIIECHPVTGRTHQIRVHLQALGHPIVNDECYGGAFDAQHRFAYPRITITDDPHALEAGHCTGIFLHAHKYIIPGWCEVETKVPEWARQL